MYFERLNYFLWLRKSLITKKILHVWKQKEIITLQIRTVRWMTHQLNVIYWHVCRSCVANCFSYFSKTFGKQLVVCLSEFTVSQLYPHVHFFQKSMLPLVSMLALAHLRISTPSIAHCFRAHTSKILHSCKYYTRLCVLWLYFWVFICTNRHNPFLERLPICGQKVSRIWNFRGLRDSIFDFLWRHVNTHISHLYWKVRPFWKIS